MLLGEYLKNSTFISCFEFGLHDSLGQEENESMSLADNESESFNYQHNFINANEDKSEKKTNENYLQNCYDFNEEVYETKVYNLYFHKKKETTLNNQLKRAQDNNRINKREQEVYTKQFQLKNQFNFYNFSENHDQNEINFDNSIFFASFEEIVKQFNNFKNVIPFKSLEEIVNSYIDYLRELWDNEDIFDSKDELVKMEECENVKKIENYLKQEKNHRKNKNGEKKRKNDKDQMTIKILTHLAISFLKATNSFEEFIKCPIATMKRELININLEPDFILEYLKQPLYAILSNESNDINSITNKTKIETIMNENDKDKEVVKHLNLTVQKCLDYFRYKEENPRFKYKLVDFLVEEFESQKKKKEKSQNDKKKEIISFSKQYIASLLLLTYNFERCFQIKKINEENRNKNKNKRNLFVSVKQIPKRNKLFVIERSINKKRKKNEKYNPKKSKRNRNINDIDEPFNCSSKKKIISLDTSDSSINNSLSRKNPFLTRKVFQENQISSKIEEINKSNNQSLKNDNDSMQNNCKIKDIKFAY